MARRRAAAPSRVSPSTATKRSGIDRSTVQSRQRTATSPALGQASQPTRSSRRRQVQESKKSKPAAEVSEAKRARRPMPRTSNAKPSLPVHKQLETRVIGQIKRLRYNQAYVEAYELEGWRSANFEKIKPSEELAKAQEKIVAAKRAIGEGLRALQSLNARDVQLQVVSSQPKQHLQATAPDMSDDLVTRAYGVAYEQIICSRCGETEAWDGNDILLCDSAGCNRAYHQLCQDPIVLTQDIPPDDQEWFCNVCLAVFTCLKRLNSTLGTTYERIDELFPELPQEEKALKGREQSELNASASSDVFSDLTDKSVEDLDQSTGMEEDEEDDDEDFQPFVKEREAHQLSEGGSSSDAYTTSDSENEDRPVEAHDTTELCQDTGSEGVVEDSELKHLCKDDILDFNSRSTRSRNRPKSTGNARESERTHNPIGIDQRTGGSAQAKPFLVDPEEEATHPSLIVPGKRKRKAVDYRALNALLFANAADSDEEAEAESPRLGQPSPSCPARTMTDRQAFTQLHQLPTVEEASRRSRRTRRPVDYRALHEGVM